MTRLLLPLLLLLCFSCRHEDVIYIPEEVPTGLPQFTSVSGFYLLNEGNMGSNKCTLDHYDYTSATYLRNIYAQANPTVPKELGDVGNDLKIYGSKLWAVVNTSNKLEVMRAADAVSIARVEIPNCRHIAFHGGYAYVTSYAGPVEIRPDYSQLGFVAKIDTATLQVVGRCIVGYQPDGLAVSGDRLYVCNSGGYRVPNYENTLSVISLDTFTEEERIPLAVNLNKIIADGSGRLWVSSRGDYFDTQARLIVYDTRKRRTEVSFPMAVSAMDIHGGYMYVCGTVTDPENGLSQNIYYRIDMQSLIISGNFITDGTQTQIKRPYGLAVNPVSGQILVTDARTYLNPGYLHAYSPLGEHLWQVRTGDIPSCIAFQGSEN